MDDYKRFPRDGHGSRRQHKQASKDSKSSFRASTPKPGVRGPVVTYILVGADKRRLWLDPTALEKGKVKPAYNTHPPTRCIGVDGARQCHRMLTSSGHVPHGARYVECEECGTHYPLIEGERDRSLGFLL